MSFYSHHQISRGDPHSHVSLSANIQHLCFQSASLPCHTYYLGMLIIDIYLSHTSGCTHSISADPLTSSLTAQSCQIVSAFPSCALAGTVSCVCKDLGTPSTLRSSLPEDVTHIFSTQLSLIPTATLLLDFIWEYFPLPARLSFSWVRNFLYLWLCLF